MRATPIAACTLAVLALDNVAKANTTPPEANSSSSSPLTFAAWEDAASPDKSEAIAPLSTPERGNPERDAMVVVGRSLPRPTSSQPTIEVSLSPSSASPQVTPELQAEEASHPAPIPVAAISEPELAPSLNSLERTTTVSEPELAPSLNSLERTAVSSQPTQQPEEPQGTATAQSTPSPNIDTASASSDSTVAFPTFQPPTGDAAELVNPDGSFIMADAPPPPPSAGEIEDLQNQLREIEEIADFGDTFEGSPAITIAIPSGYGADEGIGFVSTGFQSSVRGSDEADATATFGIGLGDAEEAVGVQLSYTIASFGTNRDFGTGGFNAKVHRRLSDNWSIAAGWDGFITVGDDNDFEDSVYGSVTYVGVLNPDINDAFSRIALTAGVGNGRFRTEEAILDEEDTIGVFGSAALRIARPVSAIVEWTGQDLALGLSIAPFRDFPLVITPALRDVAGAGDGARFVLGANVSFRF